jgi:hypothetical protein
MKLQRLKLYVVNSEEGTEVIEFSSYQDLKKYASGRKEVVEGKNGKQKIVSKKTPRLEKEGDKKLIKNSLKKRVQKAKKKAEKDIDAGETTSDTDNKSSFWDKLK